MLGAAITVFGESSHELRGVSEKLGERLALAKGRYVRLKFLGLAGGGGAAIGAALGVLMALFLPRFLPAEKFCDRLPVDGDSAVFRVAKICRESSDYRDGYCNGNFWPFLAEMAPGDTTVGSRPSRPSVRRFLHCDSQPQRGV